MVLPGRKRIWSLFLSVCSSSYWTYLFIYWSICWLRLIVSTVQLLSLYKLYNLCNEMIIFFANCIFTMKTRAWKLSICQLDAKRKLYHSEGAVWILISLRYAILFVYRYYVMLNHQNIYIYYNLDLNSASTDVDPQSWYPCRPSIWEEQTTISALPYVAPFSCFTSIVAKDPATLFPNWIQPPTYWNYRSVMKAMSRVNRTNNALAKSCIRW